MQTQVLLVDANDQPLGVAEKIYAHQHALRHRAFSIFIYREQAGQCEILLQQRQINKYHCGGLWTNTCCSHPLPNESILLAAERRLYEEMGIKIALQSIGTFCYQAAVGNQLIEHEFDHVFIGEMLNASAAIFPNPHEVSAWQWLSIEKLQEELICEPQKYTPWLSQALAIFLASRQ